MSPQQIVALITAAILSAAAQTVAQFKSFLQVTVGEVEYIASYFGYRGGPNPLDAINANLQLLLFSMENLTSDNSLTLQGVHDVLATLQRADTPVVLPTTPPAGYGGGDAAAVWAYQNPGESLTNGQLNSAAGTLATRMFEAQVRLPMFYPGGYTVICAWDELTFTPPNINYPPILDPSTIISSDASVSAWLTRIGADPAPNGLDEAGHPYWNQPDTANFFIYYLGAVEFAEYQAARSSFSPTSSLVPPIWPGVANVVKSDPLDLVDGMTVPGPLTGVEVQLTAVPAGVGLLAFGDTNSYRNIGAIVFETDDSYFEAFQALSLDKAV